jgi:hypothetical protein
MPDYKQLFTIDLRDLYGSKLDKLAAKSDKQFARIQKGIGGVADKGKVAAKSIDEINKRIDQLTKTKKLTVDLSAIRAANRELKALQKEKDKLEGIGGGGARRGLGSGLGSLGKGFLIGGISLLGASTITNAVGNAIDATSKYQKFEAVLSNTFGSRGKAQDAMQMISDFASKTPFQVDNLTNSYVKLANQGFVPTVKQLTSLGDLASSTGKDFDQLVEAMIDAQVGEFERLKEFGVRAQKEGDKVTFTFKGQTQTVKFTSQAIREYILSLGQAQGVSGAMAKISKTTGGQISNLKDNVDLMWKAIGDRLNPEIKNSTGSLNYLVNTVRKWFEIPLSKKIEREAFELRALQAELNSTNISEHRRKEILDELNSNYNITLSNINDEKKAYAELNGEINKVITSLENKAIVSRMQESLKEVENRISSSIAGSADWFLTGLEAAEKILGKDQVSDVRNNASLSTDEKLEQLKTAAYNKGFNRGNSSAYVRLSDAVQYSSFYKDVTQKNIQKRNEQKKIIEDTMAQFGIKPDEAGNNGNSGGNNNGNNGNKGSGGTGSLDTAGINSVNSGSQVKNINISIGSLVSGGVNITTNTMKDGMAKAKDIVVEALLTAVNDANLAGG